MLSQFWTVMGGRRLILPAIWSVIFAITVVAATGGGLLSGAKIVALFAGGAGTLSLFQRWRRRGDHAARTLCFAVFGLWAVAVAVGAVTNDADHLAESCIVGSALAIGLLGSIVLTMRDIRRPDRAARAKRAMTTVGVADDLSPRHHH